MKDLNEGRFGTAICADSGSFKKWRKNQARRQEQQIAYSQIICKSDSNLGVIFYSSNSNGMHHPV